MAELEKTRVVIPLSGGQDTGMDPRALRPPSLAICKDAMWRETGGIQKRYPYAALGTSILGGGTISSIRRITTRGDELIAFTDDTIYSWSESDAKWVSKGEYHATTVTEKTIFAENYSQYDCRRAELGDCVVVVWSEYSSATEEVKVAAYDKTTGNELLAPYALSNARRPRLIALTNKILLFYWDSTGTAIKGLALTPGTLSTDVAAAATTVVAAAGASPRYDVTQRTSTSAVLVSNLNPVTSYYVVSVTEALALSGSTKVRECATGPTIALTDAGDYIAIFRYDATSVAYEADILVASDLGDTAHVSISIEATADNIWQAAAAFKSTADSGEYRCYVFYSEAPDSTDETWYCRYNWVDTGGSTGTAAVFLFQMATATSAWDHNGQIFVWLDFAQDSDTTRGLDPDIALQNTLFLATLDTESGAPRGGQGKVIGKASAGASAGFNNSASYYPIVQNPDTNIYTMIVGVRRRIPIDGVWSYDNATPRELTVEFDADEARRTAQLGETLFITGSQILQYDGRYPVELGFHIWPNFYSGADTGAGSLAAGDYTWYVSAAWINARGELERSTSVLPTQVTIGASRECTLTIGNLFPTLKKGTRSNIIIEVWRTLVDPIVGAPCYLTTNPNPYVASGDNCHLVNSPTSATQTWIDSLVDSSADDREPFPEATGILESLAPPAATIILASGDRLFLAGISYDPNLVWYSKLRNSEELPSFNDALSISVPPSGGDITALGFLNEILIVFCEHAIWALAGDGYDNTGAGQNYGPARLISTDVGAENADVVAAVPDGLFFHSSKGWYLLGRDWVPRYVGGEVSNYDGDTWVAVNVLEDDHHIRCMSTSRMLVFDYEAKQWSEWPIVGEHACVWQGKHCYVSDTGAGVYYDTQAAGGGHSLIVETGWIDFNDPLTEKLFGDIVILGEYRSAHDLRIDLYRDYDSATAFQTKTWTVSPTTVGGPEIVRHSPSINLMKALKIRITSRAVGLASAEAGEGLKLTRLELEVAIEPGLGHELPPAQKQ